MNKNTKGFAVLESLLILVVIGVIGGIGWYAYNSKQKTDKILSQADKISQSTPVKSNATSTTTDTQKYIVIKEWGVRIPYNGDDTYTYKYQASVPTIIDVISSNLAKKYGCSEFGAGEIGKHKPTDPSAPDPNSETVEQYNKEHPGYYIPIGSYYYSFFHDQAACSDTVTLDAQNAANQSMAIFAKKIEAIPQ